VCTKDDVSRGLGEGGEEALVKAILLLHRREGMSVDEFRRYWRASHAPLLVQLPGLQRLVFNYGQSDGTGGAAPYDGISEDWFESAEAMQAAFSSPAGQAVLADVPNFLDPSKIQMTVVEEDEVEIPVGSAVD